MNKKKKILFLVTQSEFGGAQRFIYRLITNLGVGKYDILVGAGPEGDNRQGLLFALNKKGINVRHLKYLRRSVNPFFDFGLGLREVYGLVKQEKPDILFLCSSKAGAIGSLAARLIPKSYALNPKVIYRIGGWTFNDPWPKWKKRFYLWLERWTAKFKDIIVNNAESDQKQAQKLGIKAKDKIITIHNGVDTNMIFLSREEARSVLNVHSTNLIIGTIANLYPAKGINYLVEAATLLIKEYPDLMFVVIGEGAERKKIENQIKKLELKKNFILLGSISDAYKYLKMFDIFVLPSVKEGFPWTILEAMAADVPIIATKVGGVPEVIENEKNGLLVSPESSKELDEAIKKLLSDNDLREAFAQEAKRTVEGKFNLKQMIQQYEDLFSIN